MGDDGPVTALPALDDDARYRACASRDRRFDGWFFVGVTSTGIFCRPSCPATTPRRANVTFFPSAAAAHLAGFRACRRCRPDTAPGSPEWDVRADLTGRAVRAIDDGIIDREGVPGLARRLAVSERHLHRLLVAELGAGPLALARARRAHTARVLIETTDLPFTEIAFAAGFASIRQFNDTVRATFGASPTVLRRDRTTSTTRGRAGRPPGLPVGAAGPVPITVRLAAREPFAGAEILGFLAQRALTGVEAVVEGGGYARVLALPHGPATVVLRPAVDHVTAELRLTDLRDLAPAVERCRRLLDLDADPLAIAEVLAGDRSLRPLVAAVPGRRSPGAVDGAELVVRAVLGQQVSVAGARTLANRLVTAHGEALPPTLAEGAPTGLSHAFPTATALADLDPATVAMPRSRGTALREVAGLLASGELVVDAGADRDEVAARLTAVRGIGPWTAGYVALRALGDPDAFLPTDIGVRNGLDAIGLGSSPADATARAERWRPFRSYALHHLWAAAGAAPIRRSGSR